MEADKEELACTYAALLLHDEGLPITAEKLNAVLKAANVRVQAFWPALFGKVLANRNLDDIILSAGGGGAAAAPAPVEEAKEDKKEAKGKGKEAEKKPEEKKPEEKKEETEDVDLGGFGLFD